MGCTGTGEDGVGLSSSGLSPDFTNEVVAPGISQPMGLRFLPDGRVLVLRKTGEIMIGDPSLPLPMSTETYMQLGNINSNLERGLFDIELDPDFEANHQFYLLYTTANPQQTRVSKFTHLENGGGTSSRGDLSSEQMIWEDTDGFPQCCHYGGSLGFGPDGTLYFTIGDKFDEDSSQDLTKPSGSVLRINSDGSIPADNPFVDGSGPQADEIWAYGLRNPFRAKWDLQSNRFFVSEVGGNDLQNSYEDLHVIKSGAGNAGVNYGWPYCEGPPPHTGTCASTTHDDPIYSYRHSGLNAAIIAGPVYRGSQFPSSFQGRYFFGDFSRETIRYLTFDSGGNVSGDFDFEDEAGPVVAIEEGPDGMLYYVTISGGAGYKAAEGDLRRIYYNSGNQPPKVDANAANPASGTAPLSVQFTSDVSDAEGDSMTYEWDFGDGDTATGTVDASGAISESHQYDTNGQYSAILRVSDPMRTTVAAALTVRVGVPPTAVIESPVDGSTFRAGEVIQFSGRADDADEANPGQVTYSWVVQFGHDNHFHPVLGPVSLGAAGSSFAVNEAAHDFLGDTDFRIDLTVTDSEGLTDHTSVEIRPEKVDVTLASTPPGAELFVDFTPAEAPRVLDSVIGWEHHISAPISRCVDGVQYTFDGWSDGGAAAHDITVPDTDVTITADYSATGTCTVVDVPVTSGLVFHVLGDEGVSADGGGSISAWADQSGNGQHLSVVSGDPVWSPNELNGHATVRFDGVDDAVGAAGMEALPQGADDRTIMMYVRYEGVGYGGFSWGNLSCNRVFGLGLSNTGKYMVQGWCPANDQISDQAPGGTEWVTHGAVVSANNLSQYLDGTRIGTLNDHAFNTSNARLRLGRNLDDSTFVRMNVAEILVFDRALADSERTQIEDYFQTKYVGGSSGGGNTAPSAIDDQAAVGAAGGSVTVDVLANDSDIDGTLVPGSVTIVGAPAHGTVAVTPATGTIVYTHDGSSEVSDSFQYTVDDDEGASSNAATVTVTIGGSGGGCSGSNCVPVSNGLVMWLQADQGVSSGAGGVTQWTDQSTSGNNLTVVSGAPQLNAAALGGHATVSFDGADDGLGRANPASLPTGAADRHVFLVAKYNDLGPVGWAGFAWGSTACNQAFGAVSASTGNAAIQGWCSANDFASAVTAVGQDFLIQEARLASNALTHYINGEQVDARTHTFATGSAALRLGVELNDRNHVDMEVAEVLVYNRALSAAERSQIQAYLAGLYFGGPTNEAPVAQPDSATVTSAGSVVIDVLSNDSDADGTLVTDSVTMSTAPSHGTVSVDPSSGALTYIHDGSAPTTDSFEYTVDDDDGAVSNAATVSITIQTTGGCVGGQCVVPVTNGLVMWLQADQAVDTSGAAVTSWSDLSVSGNDLTVIAGDPQYDASAINGHAAVVFDGVDDVLGRSTPAGLPTGASDRTVFLVASYESVGWGGFTWGNLTCNRVFGLSVAKSPANLAVQGWCTANDFPSAVAGNGAGWLTQAAVVSSDAVTHYVDGTQVDQFTHTYNTGSALLRLGAELNDRAKIKMRVAEVLVYDRALGAAELSSVEGYLNDRYVGTAENMAPQAANDNVQGVAQGGAVVIDLLANDSDADGQLVPGSVTIVTGPSAGTLTVDTTDGSATYTHDGQGGTSDSFTYTVADDDGAVSGVATVSIAIDEAVDPCAGGACDVPVTDGLVMWLRTDAGVSTSGSAVTQWADQSASGNSLNLSFGDPQLLSSELNGHDVVHFDGVDDGLGRDSSAGLPTAAAARSVFMVAKYGAISQRAGMGGIAWGNLTCNQAFGLVDNGVSGNLGIQGWCPANDFTSAQSAEAAGWAVHGVHYSGGAYSLTLDGVEIGSGTHNYNTGTARVRLGIELNDRSKFLVDVAEVLVFDRALSTTERADVETYLSTRYGL